MAAARKKWASENERLQKEKRALQHEVGTAKSEFVKKTVELRGNLRTTENAAKMLKQKMKKMSEEHSKFLQNRQNTITKETNLAKEKTKHTAEMERQEKIKFQQAEQEKAVLSKKHEHLGDYKGESEKAKNQNKALKSNLRDVNDKISAVRKQIVAKKQE